MIVLKRVTFDELRKMTGTHFCEVRFDYSKGPASGALELLGSGEEVRPVAPEIVVYKCACGHENRESRNSHLDHCMACGAAIDVKVWYGIV